MSKQCRAVRPGHRSRGRLAEGGSARKQSGPFNPSVLGRAAHEVIATLCADGLREADYARISLAVHAHPATVQPTVRRQAARLWLSSATSLYFRLFALPAGWDFAGAEVSAPGCRFDIVWRNRFDGAVLADELNTGKAGDLVGGGALDDQLDRQRKAGIAMYGAPFIGIRLLVLAAPRRSFAVASDASRTSLYPEATR